MPRQEPLPLREAQICNRLRFWREGSLLSRIAFSLKAGVDSSQIARYELRRAPVKYIDAKRIAAAWGVSLRWVATGEGNPKSQVNISDETFAELTGDGALLSAVFDNYLAPLWESSEAAELTQAVEQIQCFVDAMKAGKVEREKGALLAKELASTLARASGDWKSKPATELKSAKRSGRRDQSK